MRKNREYSYFQKFLGQSDANLGISRETLSHFKKHELHSRDLVLVLHVN